MYTTSNARLFSQQIMYMDIIHYVFPIIESVHDTTICPISCI